MFILLTNDDGIFATGLRAVYKALLLAGHEVQVIAPLSEQSGVGHSITMQNPLRVKPIAEQGFNGLAVSGTPTDCVKLALDQLLPHKPDLVVSGINAGANVGPDILYSGTVAAATEAAAAGLRALSVSHASTMHVDVEHYASFAASLVQELPWGELPRKRVINVNLPACPFSDFKGLALCPQTSVAWDDWYHERHDPRGGKYWWLDGKIPMDEVQSGTDKYQLEAGWATLSPLKFDFNDRESLRLLQQRLSNAVYFEEKTNDPA